MKCEREPLLFHLARQPALVNLYATCSVCEEVEQHLPRAASDSRLAVSAVEAVWREKLRPLVSFVGIDTLPAHDRRVTRLAQKDPDDVPTGLLAELLGPCLVFSSDPHLIEVGIARKDWGNLLVQAREVGIYQAGAPITVLGTFVACALGVELGNLVLEAARRWPFPTLLAGLGSGYFLYAYWQSDRGVNHRREARSLAVDLGRGLSEFLVRVEDARALLEGAAFVPEGEPTPLSGVARVVAAAPRPLRPGEIAPSVGFSAQRVTNLLQNPIFHRTSQGHYLLGARG